MAKYLTFIVVFVVVGATFFVFWFSKESYMILPIDEPTPEANLSVYNFQNWHVFTAPSGAFKVMFPTLPQHATKNINDEVSKQEKKYDMYVSEKEDGSVFAISRITFEELKPPIDQEKMLTAMMNDMVASNSSNELRSMTLGNYNGHKSLDFAIGNKEHNIDARAFMVDNTMYVLSRITKIENYNANEYNFFINSFELITK